MPIDLLFERLPNEERQPSTTYADTLGNSLEKAHHFAHKHLKLGSGKMKSLYDLTADDTAFSPGQAVWLYNPTRKKGLSPKFSRPWQGPSIPGSKKINNLVYHIQLSSRAKPKVVHRNRLWAYSGDNPPTWLKGGTVTESESVNTHPEGLGQREPTQRTELGTDTASGSESEELEDKITSSPPQEQLRRSSRNRKEPEKLVLQVLSSESEHQGWLVLTRGVVQRTCQN